MEKVEKSARTKRVKRNIQQAVLATVAAGSIVTIGMLAPNAVQLLGLGKRGYVSKYQFASVLSRLRAKGLIGYEVGTDGRSRPCLTEKGLQALNFEREKERLAAPMRRWDKRWRMIVFDIPERRRGVRDRFRTEMREVGFYRLQDSVWVFPYDCEEYVSLLKTELGVGVDILYAVVEHIDHDKKLRDKFGLTT